MKQIIWKKAVLLLLPVLLLPLKKWSAIVPMAEKQLASTVHTSYRISSVSIHFELFVCVGLCCVFFSNLDLFSFFCMCCEYIMLHFEVDYIFLFFTSGLCSAPFESYFHTSAKPTSRLTCTKHITHNSLRRL